MRAPIVAKRDASLKARITATRLLRGVSAGSALLAIEGRLLAIQDDAFAAVWINPDLTTERLVLRGDGTKQVKDLKPDFEAAFTLGGKIWVMGSGSRSNRRCITRVDLARKESTLLNAFGLYGAIERAIGSVPNVEGALALADRLRLFHRGPGAQGISWTVDLPFGVLAMAPAEAMDARPWELGAVNGIRYSFTDVVHLDDERQLYLAVAENAPDAIQDGPVAGAAVGIIEGESARWIELTESDGRPSVRKCEGVTLDADGRGGWLLTDPDDANRPAELCRLELTA